MEGWRDGGMEAEEQQDQTGWLQRTHASMEARRAGEEEEEEEGGGEQHLMSVEPLNAAPQAGSRRLLMPPELRILLGASEPPSRTTGLPLTRLQGFWPSRVHSSGSELLLASPAMIVRGRVHGWPAGRAVSSLAGSPHWPCSCSCSCTRSAEPWSTLHTR